MAEVSSNTAKRRAEEDAAAARDGQRDGTESAQHLAKDASREAYNPPAIEHKCWYGKRAFDVVGAIAIAAVFSPVVLVIFASLMVTGGSPVFGHQRIGKNGKRFICYKFRTMVPDAEEALDRLIRQDSELRAEWVQHHKLKVDPRVTRLGAILRRTSLDELPQLWNVIRGDMSLVGPRPIVEEEIFRYGRAFRHYLALRPGITGLWQVTGRNDVDYVRRVALDRMYAMRSCAGLDVRILFRTLLVVIERRGAY
jgi:lipopolysaccharide/colanic/teichoic acid biosynthesis glycosyltransferase